MSLSRVILLYFLGLQPRDRAAMLVVYNRIFARRIYMKIEFSSQERQAFVLLAFGRCDVMCKKPIVTLATIALRGRCRKGWEKGFRTGAGIRIRNTHVRT